MAQRGLFAIALAVTTLLAVGCAATVDVPQSGPVAMYPQPNGGMDALLEGTLTVIEDCVVVTQSDGSIAVPVFPVGDASWDGDEGVLSWRGDEFREGDPISVGGGFSDAALTAAYIPTSCAGTDTFAVSPF